MGTDLLFGIEISHGLQGLTGQQMGGQGLNIDIYLLYFGDWQVQDQDTNAFGS